MGFVEMAYSHASHCMEFNEHHQPTRGHWKITAESAADIGDVLKSQECPADAFGSEGLGL
jgi:hypothetical protein